jgi:hypothetical protein
MTPLVFKLGSIWGGVCGHIYTPAALPPGKEPGYSLNRLFGGPLTRPGVSLQSACHLTLLFDTAFQECANSGIEVPKEIIQENVKILDKLY